MADAKPPSPATPPTRLLEGAALFLDFDGTIVELARTPGGVVVDARLTQLLTRLSERLEGRLAIVSGRPVATLRALLPQALVMVGSHGMEFATPDGAIDVPLRPAVFGEIVERMERLAAERPGLIVEDKPLGAALHYRQSPAAEAACIELAEALAAEHGMHLQPGKMMVEVRTPGGDKGSAITRLMREPEMRGARPLFMGDDLTDEPGFAVAAKLGGHGILVGRARPTQAHFRLDRVSAALDWLATAAAGTA